MELTSVQETPSSDRSSNRPRNQMSHLFVLGERPTGGLVPVCGVGYGIYMYRNRPHHRCKSGRLYRAGHLPFVPGSVREQDLLLHRLLRRRVT